MTAAQSHSSTQTRVVAVTPINSDERGRALTPCTSMDLASARRYDTDHPEIDPARFHLGHPADFESAELWRLTLGDSTWVFEIDGEFSQVTESAAYGWCYLHGWSAMVPDHLMETSPVELDLGAWEAERAELRPGRSTDGIAWPNELAGGQDGPTVTQWELRRADVAAGLEAGYRRGWAESVRLTARPVPLGQWRAAMAQFEATYPNGTASQALAFLAGHGFDNEAVLAVLDPTSPVHGSAGERMAEASWNRAFDPEWLGTASPADIEAVYEAAVSYELVSPFASQAGEAVEDWVRNRYDVVVDLDYDPDLGVEFVTSCSGPELDRPTVEALRVEHERLAAEREGWATRLARALGEEDRVSESTSAFEVDALEERNNGAGEMIADPVEVVGTGQEGNELTGKFATAHGEAGTHAEIVGSGPSGLSASDVALAKLINGSLQGNRDRPVALSSDAGPGIRHDAAMSPARGLPDVRPGVER